MCGNPRKDTPLSNPTPSAATPPISNINTAPAAYVPAAADEKYLTDMGFSREEAGRALRQANGNKQVALDFLIAEVAKSPNKQASPPLQQNKPAATTHTVKPIGINNVPTTKSTSTTTTSNTANINKATATPAQSTPITQATNTTSHKPTTLTSSTTKPQTVPSTAKPTTAATPAAKSTASSVSLPVKPTITPSNTVATIAKPAAAATPSTIKPTPTGANPTKPVTASAETKSADPGFEKREAERERLFKQLEQEQRREQEEKERNVKAEAEALKEALRLRKEAEEKEKKLRAIEKERQLLADRAADVAERKARRDAEESKITSIDQALQRIKESYDVDRYHNLINLLIKVIQNILSDPDNEKFRTIRANSEKIQKLVVRPLGGQSIMRLLGFQQQENKEAKMSDAEFDAETSDFSFYLPKTKLNQQLLNGELKKLQQEVAGLTTIVPKMYAAIEKNKKYSLEDVYFGSLELYNILSNVTADSEAIDNLRIDVHSRSYIKRLKPIPEFLQLIDYFGFKPDPHGVYLVNSKPDLKLIETGRIELQQQIAARAAATPIFKATQQLLLDNKGKIVKSFVEAVVAAAEKVLAEPHEQKFHKIKLDKFYAKTGEVKQGNEFFELMGFEADPVQQIAVLPYPGYDPELLKLRTEDLQRAWKYALEVGRLRRAQA
jgi:hypothetical protein